MEQEDKKIVQIPQDKTISTHTLIPSGRAITGEDVAKIKDRFRKGKGK